MANAQPQLDSYATAELLTTPRIVGEPRDWQAGFRELFLSAVKRYQAGLHDASAIFGVNDVAFLATIGANTSEVYDYVEDWCEMGEPSLETVLGIMSVRHEYFIGEQQRRHSGIVRSPDTFPSENARLGGFVWLPRIIAKARAKLRGELPPELMYGCPRDRAFLKSIGANAVEFLQTVWMASDNERHILEFVRTRSGAHALAGANEVRPLL